MPPAALAWPVASDERDRLNELSAAELITDWLMQRRDPLKTAMSDRGSLFLREAGLSREL
jgi:hypothetical protein